MGYMLMGSGAMSVRRRKIGEIFVENGIITKMTLERALARACSQQRRLGFVLEDMGVVTGEEIAQALADQFGYARAGDLAVYEFNTDLQKLISVDDAFSNMLFPLKLENNILFLATADPTDTRIIMNISKNNCVAIVLFVATRSEIIEAINRNYLGKASSGHHRKTVVVAVENLDTYVEIEKVLASKGYRVMVAGDGIQAFKMILSESPSVVLVEKELGKLDGYRLIEAMNNLPEAKHIPTIMIGDGTCPEDELISYDRGFFEFIKTPIDTISLMTKVKKAIDAFDKTHNFR